MPVVWIPSLLRQRTNGQETVRVPGRTVREVIDELDKLYPGIKQGLCDENGLRPFLTVFVNSQLVGRLLSQPVDEASEIHFIPAIAGGDG
jgi:molybdopterin converting factor small subunit